MGMPAGKLGSAAPSHEGTCVSGTQASSCSSRAERARESSSAREPQPEETGSSPGVATISTALDRDGPSQSELETVDESRPLGDRRSTNAVGTNGGEHGPPWLIPECSPSVIGAWSTLLQRPWPVGILPGFGTVFCHEWMTQEESGAKKSRSINNVPSVFAATTTQVTMRPEDERQHTTTRSPRPGGLLGTVLRLVAGIGYPPTVLSYLGGYNQVPPTRVTRTQNTVQRHDEPVCSAEYILFLFCADPPPSNTSSIPHAPPQSTAWQDLPSPGLAPSDLPPRECHREV